MQAIGAVRRQVLEAPTSRGIPRRNRPVSTTRIVLRGLVATRKLEPLAARGHVPPPRRLTTATVRILTTTTETIRISVLTVRRPRAPTPRRGLIPPRAAAIRHLRALTQRQRRRAPTPLRHRHAPTPRQAVLAAAVVVAIVVVVAVQARTAAEAEALTAAAEVLLLTAGPKILAS